jgi:valyl-tRNA synthetase
MDKHYDPQSVESKWYAWWEENGCFHAEAAQGGEPYCIVIPPPNVTGILHMGHALNNTVQDVLARWRRMQGRNVLWVPGTDHAGIATQNVVEKALKKEGKTRRDLGREAFVEKVWEWRRQYGGSIVGQLRKLGCSCDWTRERFTMDAGLSDAVAEVFCRLYAEGLVYRGNYIVNWCPRCGTALADDESEHQPNNGSLWHIRYPVKDAPGEFVQVATTRPETLPGDTAVAVNPKDERYAHLHGRSVILPLSGKEIPVVADDYVERGFGTGVVKITPAHDANDFGVAQRHALPAVNIMNGDGTMNELSGYEGLDRFECRTRIVADLEAGGHLVKVEPYQNAVGHCYRCDTVVESRLSRQGFVRMKPLAEQAMAAVREGKTVFTPRRYENTFFTWMENIRDWCISRQIWWGHRIPVYTCACGHEWAAPKTPQACPACGAGADAVTQDNDVLDTWFSSWLWPFSTLGWPDRESADLAFYYPTADLVTAPDIIFFLVARMMMAGCKFMGEAPFANVVIHGVVRDAQGRKMSKSLGNSIDPLTIVEQHSADALRFSLMQITSPGMDVFIDVNKFEIGRNFATKIWNAARFIEMNAEKSGFPFSRAPLALDPALLSDDDRHLLASVQRAVAAVDDALGKYRFQDAALAIYELVWTQFCDWYLEYAKKDLNGDDPARRAQVLAILYDVLGRALRLLHPFMPFLTEELWHQLGYAGEKETVMTAPWPAAYTPEENTAWGLSDDVAAYVNARRELVTAGRALRADYNLAPSKFLHYIVQAVDDATAARLAADADTLRQQMRSDNLEIVAGGGERAMPGTLCKLGTVYLPLEGLVDITAEAARVKAELGKTLGFLKGVEAKLGNEGFVSKAPAAVIEQQRAKQKELAETAARLQKLLATFGG